MEVEVKRPGKALHARHACTFWICFSLWFQYSFCSSIHSLFTLTLTLTLSHSHTLTHSHSHSLTLFHCTFPHPHFLIPAISQQRQNYNVHAWLDTANTSPERFLLDCCLPAAHHHPKHFSQLNHSTRSSSNSNVKDKNHTDKDNAHVAPSAPTPQQTTPQASKCLPKKVSSPASRRPNSLPLSL